MITPPTFVQLLGMAAVAISGLWALSVAVQALDQWQRKAFPPKGRKG